MQLVNVQNKSWWVPESHPMALAVPIQLEGDYLPAIRLKLLELVRQAGPLPKVLETVTWLMEPQGLEVQPTDSPDNLVDQLLATASVGEMVRAGHPAKALAAPADEAVAAVEAQSELRLEDFLA
jgi:hypothetical protein